MQTNRRSDQLRTITTSTMALYVGDGTRTTGAEADFRAGRLLAEAARDRLVGRRDGLRQWIGHRLMDLGQAIHGLEPEPKAAPRPVLDAR